MTMMHKFMKIAIDEAKNSLSDIPVCAIVVKNGEIISKCINRKEKDNLATSHAEILAINEANKKLGSWRLLGCDMYVTLEPCPMCAWAVLSARFDNIYFGSYDTKYGAFGGTFNLSGFSEHKIKIFGGIMEKECDELLNSYFKRMRNEKTAG